ncbi:MAG: hypothetical protein ACLTWO_13740 [Blautia massiliensis (ex Durand et al. 2017)]|nr:MAG: hypothetical protein DBX91_06355 [Subdoligranulum variabile]
MAEHWIAVSDEENELIRLLRKLPDSAPKECIYSLKVNLRMREIRQKMQDEYTAAKTGYQKQCVIVRQNLERRRILIEYESGSGTISREEYDAWKWL